MDVEFIKKKNAVKALMLRFVFQLPEETCEQ